MKPHLLLVLVYFFVACGPEQSAAPTRAQVTMFTLQAALAANVPSLGEGLSKVFPGFPPNYFLKSASAIKVASAYTAGRPTPYMTTDIWINYPAVWIQPLYIFVTAWDSKAPRMNLHPHKWVLGTGPKSPFWSPFWQTFFVELPADVPDGTYSSVRAILNAKLPVHAAGGRLASVVPDGMRPDDTGLFPPFEGTVSKGGPDSPGTPVAIRSWVDGTLQDVLDFGPDRFEWNDKGEVLDAPLFFFFIRGSDGRPTPLAMAPRIGGTGPLFERRPAIAPANRPLFGSFWRLWAAHLPPGKTSVFIPRGAAWDVVRDDWRRAAASAGYTGPVIAELKNEAPEGAPVTDLPAKNHAVKIALAGPDDRCFENEASLASCKWLDSQEALEAHLGANLQPSEITVSCPYMGYAGVPVPRFP